MNTGRMMSRYETYHHLDYVSFSTSEYRPRWAMQMKHENVTPIIRNYDSCLKFDYGMLLHWHSKKPQMKQHITLSGQTLSNMRERNISDAEIIEWLQSLDKPKFGRVDIAVTSVSVEAGRHEFTPERAWKLYTEGKCETRLKADKPIVDIEKNVETFYVGSRKSRQRLLRIYDSGLKMFGTANTIIRMELETREYASKIADEVRMGHNIAGMIRRYVDYPSDRLWIEIMDSKPLPRYRIENNGGISDRDVENKKVWLMTSVAPAMAKLAKDIGWENKFWDEFTRRTAYEFHKIDGESS